MPVVPADLALLVVRVLVPAVQAADLLVAVLQVAQVLALAEWVLAALELFVRVRPHVQEQIECLKAAPLGFVLLRLRILR